MVSCQKGPTRHAWQDTLDFLDWYKLILLRMAHNFIFKRYLPTIYIGIIRTIIKVHYLWWSNKQPSICPQGRVQNQLTNNAMLRKIMIRNEN